MVGLNVPPTVHWELIVINNNGTDETDAVVRSFEGQMPVRLVQEPTPGLSHARNRAIKVATGDVMLWTDDDVLVEPGWMAAIVRGFDQFGADFVFGPSRPLWEEGTKPDWFSPLHHGKLGLIDYGPEAFMVKDMSTLFFGLNFAVKRDVLIALGRFREDLGVKEASGGGEDIDLFRRACDGGHPIVYVPDAIVNHVIPPLRMTRRYHRIRTKEGLPTYYRMLEEQYARQPWLLGVPRFLYGKALSDAVGYARSVVGRDKPSRFHFELQMLKFGGICRQAVRTRRARGRSPDASRRGHQA